MTFGESPTLDNDYCFAAGDADGADSDDDVSLMDRSSCA
jgi:hypothetical protein